VYLRIAVWVVVLGVGYLLFGPQLFDSSRDGNPLGTTDALYLPPSKSGRLVAYERLAAQRELGPEEQAEYRSLVEQRQADFWTRNGTTVEQALAGVDSGRGAHLAGLLAERGLSNDEITVFMMVVRRDHPALLEDR